MRKEDELELVARDKHDEFEPFSKRLALIRTNLD
jgi:hypothetical protein